MEDVQLKFPAVIGTIAKTLTAPKSDVVFGSRLDASQYIDPVYKDEPPSVYSLDGERVRSIFTVSEFSDVSCGAIEDKFCFPTFTIQRKSDSGSCFLAQNQLFGTLRCILEAQMIAKRRINNSLPVLALGLVNVGNWTEFWGAWPSEDDQVILLFIYPSHLFAEYILCLAHCRLSSFQCPKLCRVHLDGD